MNANGQSRAAINDVFRLINSGQIQQAEGACRSLLEDSPEDINVLGLLGAILLKLGQTDEAKQMLQQAIRLEPLFPKPYEDLGMACLREGDAVEARNYFEKAIQLDGSQASAYGGLAKALLRSGDPDAAEAARQKYLSLSPVARTLAKAEQLLAVGDADAAEKLCDQISREHPNNTDALRMLARIASESGRQVIAEGLLKRIINLSPDDYGCHVDFGLYLAEQGRYPEAVEVLEKAAALDPTVISTQQRLGDFLAIIGRSADALAVYERALDIDSNSVPALVGRGHMLRILGQAVDAIESYESGLRLRPDFGDAWWSLASLRNYRFSDEQLRELRTQLEKAEGNSTSTISLHFALARASEKKQDFENAWLNYELGNALKRSAVQYDPVRIETGHDSLIEFFDGDFFARHEALATAGPIPIFIVGMPRSGSTLLEQILASHSQVEGAAELPYMGLLAESLGGPRSKGARYPEVIEDMTTKQLAAFGKSYLYYSRANRPDKSPFFTDKMPANFAHVGLIHLALPNARIIDARRHPLDVCVGNYRQLFAAGKNHAYDLNECAEYYLEYIRMMEHWDEVLPGRVLKVQYEDVIGDTEEQARRMLDYCGLDWEDACLKFYETDRPVNTASSEQVREPIYKDAVAYWKHYEAHLDDVKQILEPVLSERSQK